MTVLKDLESAVIVSFLSKMFNLVDNALIILCMKLCVFLVYCYVNYILQFSLAVADHQARTQLIL